MTADRHELAPHIEAYVRDVLNESGTVTRFREPLVGFSPIRREQFERLRAQVPEHILPEDVLPHARGLISFFLPFSRTTVATNASLPHIAREWAVAYVETNALICEIGRGLVGLLARRGVNAAAEPPTYEFDRKKLVARWSHKSIACMTGMGSFGLHRLLITDAGCAGRFGSLVVDTDPGVIPPEPRERCLYFYDGSCGACVARCPVGALSSDGTFDRQSCYARVLEADRYFADLPVTDVCGKCSVGIPCAMVDPVAKKLGLQPTHVPTR